MTDSDAGRRQGGAWFGQRVALFYGALFVVYGTHVPYMPLWLNWRGLSPAEISIVTAAPFFLRLLITPLAAVSADRNSSHRALILALSAAALGFVSLLTQASGFWTILALAVPLAICNSTVMPLVETIAVAGMRQRGLDYGRMRLWGSLTFVAASFAGGFAVTRYGDGAGVWLVLVGTVLTVLAALALPRDRVASDHTAAAADTPIWRAKEPWALVRHPTFRMFLVAAGAVQAAHATFLGFGTLIWQRQGLPASWFGTLWAVGVFAEVAVFALSSKLVAAFGAARLILIGAAASVVRWTVMGFSPPVELLVPLQLLHGVTFGAAHIGAIHFIHDAAPREISGTAQALYATVAAGLAMGFATLIAGAIFERAGGQSYFAMAAIALVALLASVNLVRSWQGETLAISPDDPRQL